MITFSQYITELFDKPLSFEKEKNNNPIHHTYNFNTDKSKYKVNFIHHNDGKPEQKVGFFKRKPKTIPTHSHVDFSSEHDTSSHNKMAINNQEGHSATHVFSTVHHIIKQHMAENPHIQHLSFSAHNSEPSRVKLYNHFAKKFTNKHNQTQTSSSTQFHFHRDDVK
jgi:hypothetical protein